MCCCSRSDSDNPPAIRETIYSGAPDHCEDCGWELVPRVYDSGTGSYVGTSCRCGPYSRESGYFATRAEAEAILIAGPAEYARASERARSRPRARD